MVLLSLIAFSTRPSTFRRRVATGSLGSRAWSLYACMAVFRVQYPAHTCPVQRFKYSLATAIAWLGVRMIATPFLYDSFIHYSTPVYPDATPVTKTDSTPRCPCVRLQQD